MLLYWSLLLLFKIEMAYLYIGFDAEIMSMMIKSGLMSDILRNSLF